MPARYEPRQRNEPNLRHARAQAGYRSQDALANALDTDRTVIAKAETGERPPNDTLLNAWLDKCEVTGLARAAVEGECRLTQSKEGPVKVWVAPWFETEAKAHTLRYWAPVIVPGLAKLLPPVGPP